MKAEQARACWKSVLRNHPFFKYSGYQPWGWDWPTFHACYPNDARRLREIVDITEGADR